MRYMEREKIKETLAKKQRLFYCSHCGNRLINSHDGERERPYCTSCDSFVYENPGVGVAAVVLDDNNRILLGRRKIGRKKGLWCIPCGYVDCHEDVWDAVVRELKEETNLDIIPQEVLQVRSNFFPPQKHAVGIWFMARWIGGELRAQDDLEDAGFFYLDDLPQMAFEGDLMVIEKIRQKYGI